MRANLFGITNIRVEHFTVVEDDINLINDFLEEHNSNIIDIQYQQNNSRFIKVLVIYQEK